MTNKVVLYIVLAFIAGAVFMAFLPLVSGMKSDASITSDDFNCKKKYIGWGVVVCIRR